MILIITIVGCLSIPIILYFTIGQQKNNSQKINLNEQSLNYLAKVEHMKSIKEQEAIKIKSDIQANINNKMTSLNLDENVDYKINNLDTIKQGASLDNIHITIDSLSTSTKATGNFTIRINSQENINDRSIQSIAINANEANGLSAIKANNIQNQIILSVDSTLNEGQMNEKDVDYKINNLGLIQAGAKFADYNTQLSVIGISIQLEGSFSIIFTLTE
ncbi:hypothetical protein [Spiroplasma platyhelix]|uniref:Uncharacterized protein n=1 Tax=Spiroplasma platyhelix PALS-1 TaxID=1276218 RepID=A0A846TQB0_9MOLU|nr:hypothetical protein [Spiroplasma platyhelix]MBE4704131.1 hypothetical protein [Spiroplasma platyhelix PALS-1]NKE38500.1 hypothetical protein [Spiroplasma platyhelix PALS-1]UJB29389.1 hypothetical protein SPLAT_v1c06250 [Spiroplasma platyhelix PALS-1]